MIRRPNIRGCTHGNTTTLRTPRRKQQRTVLSFDMGRNIDCNKLFGVSNLPEMAPPQLQHKYLEANIPSSILSGFTPLPLPNVKPKQVKNTSNNEPQKWIAQANKISTQLPNKACKLYLDAAKELAIQHNIQLASEALHSLVATSTAEKLTGKAHLLLARLLRLFDIAHSSYHYECSFKSYFSLTACSPPPIPSLSSSFQDSNPISSTPASPLSKKDSTSSTLSTPSRDHPPLPPRSQLMRDSRTWANALMQEILRQAPNDDVATTSDDESTEQGKPTMTDQIKTALECLVEAGGYSQDPLFSAIVCDVCHVCDCEGLLKKVGLPPGDWITKAAEKYAIAGVQSHSIDALLDSYQKEPSGQPAILLKALSKAIIIDDRVRVQRILGFLGTHQNTQEAQCMIALGHALADADTVALDAVANDWRSVLACCEDARDALTCAMYHLS